MVKRKRFNKFGIESDMMGWIIIAIVILVIALVGYLRWKGVGLGAIDSLKNLFRLRG
ncbi:hypothetical protein KAR91_16405 [Candidatus Pacearchaeota archaeon]|nr:hypothetical protein [Candidatus Pacearchaeota archaeon]